MRSYDRHDLVEIALVVHHEQSELMYVFFFLNVQHEHNKFLKQKDSYSEPNRGGYSIPASAIVSLE
jgi:hypothetical protein